MYSKSHAIMVFISKPFDGYDEDNERNEHYYYSNIQNLVLREPREWIVSVKNATRRRNAPSLHALQYSLTR